MEIHISNWTYKNIFLNSPKYSQIFSIFDFSVNLSMKFSKLSPSISFYTKLNVPCNVIFSIFENKLTDTKNPYDIGDIGYKYNIIKEFSYIPISHHFNMKCITCTSYHKTQHKLNSKFYLFAIKYLNKNKNISTNCLCLKWKKNLLTIYGLNLRKTLFSFIVPTT